MRFYFHIADDRFLQDKDGTELPDHHVAKVEALHYARSLANLEEEFSGRLTGGEVIVVDQ